MSNSLSKEPEQEICAAERGQGAIYQSHLTDLLAEIDRLRAALAESEEIAIGYSVMFDNAAFERGQAETKLEKVIAALEQLELLADDYTGLELIRQTLKELKA